MNKHYHLIVVYKTEKQKSS